MADPVFIDLPADTWTKVATSVLTGNIFRKNKNPKYLQVYCDTGGTAPTLKSDGVPMFEDYPNREPIRSINLIDAYVYPVGAAGRVRVDL